jgi:hypothetical protein
VAFVAQPGGLRNVCSIEGACRSSAKPRQLPRTAPEPLQVVVEESNQQARSFYRRSGFVAVEPELFELILPSAD